jgi:NADH-quinone oxidoreductase subunit M
MMLLSLLLLPFLAGLLSLISNSHQRFWPRLWGILGLLSSIVMLIVIGQHTNLSKTSPDFWALQWQTPWIPSLGISFHLGLDGLSFCLIALVLLVGLLAIILAQKLAWAFLCSLALGY